MNVLDLSEISTRMSLQPGDIGYITYLHGKIYREEYGYGIGFETYVAKGLAELHERYNPQTSRVWVCEHQNQIVGFLALVNREEWAQLRYFILTPSYRGIGLGKKLMTLYMEFLQQCGYKKSYLLTTHELHAAAKLYTQFGFRLVARTPSTAFGKEVSEDRYEWRAE